VKLRPGLQSEVPPDPPLVRCGHNLPEPGEPDITLYRGQGNLLLRYHGLADYFVAAAGDAITVTAHADAVDDTLADLLLGLPFAYVLFLRGLVPFHASAVAHAGAVVGFLGPGYAGKSSLAAACLAHGARLVADDILIAEPTDQGIRVHPGHPTIRIAPPALERVGPAGLYKVLIEREGQKSIISPHAEASANAYTTYPLHVLHLLDPRTDRGDLEITLIGASGAAARLSAQVFGFTMLNRRERQLVLAKVAQILDHVPVFAVRLPTGLDRLGDSARQLLAVAPRQGTDS